MKDLEGKMCNGRVEMGLSPFDKQEFIRMDGQTARLEYREVSPSQNLRK